MIEVFEMVNIGLIDFYLSLNIDINCLKKTLKLL